MIENTLPTRGQIMAVDDQPENLRLLEDMLRQRGYLVRSFPRGRLALAAAGQNPPDLILLDITMPEMNGYEVCERLKADEKLAGIPVIFLSALDEIEDKVRAFRAGGVDYISKPFQIDEVQARVETHMQLHRLHRALQVEKDRLEDHSSFALSAAGAGVWEADLATGATHWSREVGPMFGLPLEPFETSMDAFRARVHPDDLAMINASIVRSIEMDVPYSVEFRAPQTDGTSRWLAAKGRVSRSADGVPVSMLGIVIDVSDRKHLEQQLHQAQKMESMGQLAGGIAHDFNNVLTAILGFSDLLLKDLDPADLRARDVTEIRKAGESGQRLTRQLLAFSRQAALDPSALDLNAVVRSSQGLLKQLLGSSVRLELRLQEPLADVWADAGQMQQILVNLAVNARDAMAHRGQLCIETSTVTRAETPDAIRPERLIGPLAGPQVVLAVTDTGTGMSPETIARIFEPFFTTKGPDKGTGLGLSTVYGIVRQSGGMVDVTSTPGQGTTFRIHLPILNQTLPTPAAK
ncbi:MAG TPA: response regulator [Vicinamibacterales bacterium]|jgi:PAS domain S-box-containing protein|nr:response regulator [Vicinamibacterales bacterium]